MSDIETLLQAGKFISDFRDEFDGAKLSTITRAVNQWCGCNLDREDIRRVVDWHRLSINDDRDIDEEIEAALKVASDYVEMAVLLLREKKNRGEQTHQGNATVKLNSVTRLPIASPEYSLGGNSYPPAIKETRE